VIPICSFRSWFPSPGRRLDAGGRGKEEGGTPNKDGAKDILLGKWHKLKGQVRAQWGKVTDDDLTRLSGKTEELAGVLQQRYGYERSRADAEINDWLNAR
jgi:uncharacterized protein YjbJ (UPF0337 family)